MMGKRTTRIVVQKKFATLCCAILSLSLLEPGPVLGIRKGDEYYEGAIWWDQAGQSVIIEAASSEDLQSLNFNTTKIISTHPSNHTHAHSRTKRQFGSFSNYPFQFQFPGGWPFIQQPGQGGQGVGGGGSMFPGFPGFPSGFPSHQHQHQPVVTAPTHPPPTTTTTTTTTTSTTMAPSQIGSCKTRNGLEGQCATFRSCYPFVFSSLEGEEDKFRNPGLAEDIKERAGPCDYHSMPNYLIFRADVQTRDNMVCCAGDSSPQPPTSPNRPPIPGVSNPFHPQVTMRPPWAIWSTRPPQTHPTYPSWTQPSTTTTSTTTTTTTPRPQTHRTTASSISNLYPNWPPPFITHPPSHFPAWVHQTFGTQQTTSSTTTMRPSTSWPSHHWPPYPTQQQPQQPIHPQMTTPPSAIQPPTSSSCGTSKIVGGTQAAKAEFPWLVAIMRHGRQICGGSLIDSQWILSAAHCFTNFQPHDVAGLRIQIGDYDIYSNTDGPVTIRSVTKLVRHTGFSMAILHNDVALLKLDSPVQFGNNGNNNIQPICLTRSGGYEGTTVTVAGWGGIYEGGPQPAIYRKVNLQVWDNAQCAAKYGHRAPGGITSNMVCAGTTNADACRGDSGGPLMRNLGGSWEQIGIVSWGIGCGSYPGVYTRVDKYSDWIANNRHH